VRCEMAYESVVNISECGYKVNPEGLLTA